MIEGDRGIILRQVGTLFRAGTFAGMSDGQLLESFLARKGEAGELAFSVLVERHGPMVLRVCRGVLGDRHDAEDAFQATFLALVRGAGSIRRRDSVAPWLHGAALRVSACARTAGARRKKHEGRSAAGRLDAARDREADDLGAVLHEEVGRLPPRYRAAVLLCDLEGLPLVEAARHLGCPVGTVKSRVARGRERLRARLVRRGVVPTTASAVGVALAREARSAVRPALAEMTARLALRFAGGRGTAGMLVSPAEWLARLDHRRLLMARVRTMAMGLATVGVLAAGTTLLGQFGPAPGGGEAKEARADRLYAKTYGVADLVGARTLNVGEEHPKYDMAPLVELLTSSVAPGTWRVMDEDGRPSRDEGGPGSIIPFHLSLSLIVRHTPEAHAQFAERLAQLRRVLGTYHANSALNASQPLPPGGPPSAAQRASSMMGGRMMMGAQEGRMMMGSAAMPGSAMMGPTSDAARKGSGARAKGTDARSKSRAMMGQPARPGSAAGGMMGPMMGPGDQPGTAQGGAPGMPGAAPVPGTMPTSGQPGAANLPPGASGLPGEVHAPTIPAGASTDGPIVPQGAYPGGQTQLDVNIMYPVGADGKRIARAEAPREAETERRLRALEEKLDRVLKALDVPRSEPTRDAPKP